MEMSTSSFSNSMNKDIPGEEMSFSHASPDDAPSRSTQDDAPSQPIEDDAPSHPIQDDAPSQPIEDDAPSHPIQDDAPSQLIEDDAPSSPAQDEEDTGSADAGENSEKSFLRNKELHKGDVLSDEYEVMSDAVYGGMSCVWQVRHIGEQAVMALRRPLLTGKAPRDEQICKEFIAVAELWASLGAHPDIVRCSEVCAILGGPAVFNEWMDGGSLFYKIRDGSLYEGEPLQIHLRILDIALRTARGLQFAHSNGIVHCDMKPANVMFDVNGNAKVTDFGLSRRIVKRGAEEPEVQARGYTPQYCPGELAEGQPVKPWMDVYSWALTVLEMYLGQRAWLNGADVPAGLEEYISRCRLTPPPAMRKLLADCLKWKINDFLLVIKDLDKIISNCEDDPEAFMAAISDPPEVYSAGYPEEGAAAPAETFAETSAEAPVENSQEKQKDDGRGGPGLFGRLKNMLFGGRRN